MQQKTIRSRAARAVNKSSGLTFALTLTAVVTHTAVNATGSNAAVDEPASNPPTAVARAVNESVVTSYSERIRTGDNVTPSRQILLERSREMMQADNREVDDVALRLKAIIKARYEAELRNAQSLETIRELRAKIAEYEALLNDAQDQQRLLNADKEALQDRLTLVLGERDNALQDLGLLDGRVKDQSGQVEALQTRIDDLTDQRDDAVARSEEAEKALQDKQRALAASEAILNERENKLSRLNGLMTDKADELGSLVLKLDNKDKAVGDLEARVGELTKQRDNARKKLAATTRQVATVQDQIGDKAGQLSDLQKELNNMTSERDDASRALTEVRGELADRQGEIAELEEQLADLGTQRAEAVDQVQELQRKLADTAHSADNFLAERDALAGKLGLFENKAADAGNSFMEEQQEHTQTRAELFALKREADGLKREIDQLDGEKDALLGEVAELKSSRAALGGQLQAKQNELQTRQNELQSALSSIANLNGRIAELAKERELLATEAGELGDEVVALRAGMDNAKGDYQADLDARKQTIAKLRTDLDDATDELVAAQKQTADIVADRERAVAELNTRKRELDELGDNITALKASRDEALEEIDRLNAINSKLDTDLADANQRFDQLRADSGAQLADLEKNLLELSGTRDSQAEKIDKLASFNDELAGKLKTNRTKLDLVSTQGAEKIKQLGDQLEKMLSREKLYKANLLESGDKLAELASRNEGLTAALNAERERASVLQQDVARANAEAGVYGDELQSAELKLRELMAAQQKAEAERDRIAAESEQLRLSLTKELDDARLENITVQQARADNSIPITLGNADFFETGSAKLTEAGGQKLTQLANIIHSYHNHRIVVEGHTDNVPIGPMLLSRFASNWELSVARAAAAVRHMQSETDIDPHKLAAAGYGEFKPVGDNSTEEGKQLNRRIEVVLYPRKTEYKNIDDVGSITAIDE